MSHSKNYSKLISKTDIEVPFEIQSISILTQEEKQLLSLIYFKDKWPQDTFSESMYGLLIQNMANCMRKLFINKEKLELIVTRLVKLKLIDDRKYRRKMLKSLKLNEKVLTKMHAESVELQKCNKPLSKRRNIFQKLAFLYKVSCKILWSN